MLESQSDNGNRINERKYQENYIIMRSWDIWDTLVARRCFKPYIIFQIMERKNNVQGFAKMRILAEQRAVKKYRNYTLDNIYQEIQALLQVSDEFICNLKQMELDVEYEQAIPVLQNINRVQAGDLLLSDMYLPKFFIQKILKKVGLRVPVELVITSGGKSSGEVWKELFNQNVHVLHVGDHAVSDIQIPGEMGMDVEMSVLTNLNPVETYLIEQKEFDLAAHLRSIRLKKK